MYREPCLDIAATFRRQFVVDVGVQLVFGDGDVWVGHCRLSSLSCLITVVSDQCPCGLPSSLRNGSADRTRLERHRLTPDLCHLRGSPMPAVQPHRRSCGETTI